MKTAILLVMVCGSIVAAGCGQKGALYLPDKNAAVVTRPAQPTATPSQQPQNKDKNDDDSQSSKPKS